MDVQLTGCPVTRTGQLNLDQLIPAVCVHSCLQFEDWFKKKTRKEKNILATKSFDSGKHRNCKKYPSYAHLDGRGRKKEGVL